MPEYNKSCWIITEGIAGTENQCLGLAEALGVAPVLKRIRLRAPWKQLSPWLSIGHQFAIAPGSDRIDPPFPDILIASGRKSIGIARHIKKKHPATFLVQVQDPRFPLEKFDLVVVPQHDPARGPNVIVTTGALHRVTPEKLAAEGAKFPQLAALPGPRVAVLIGGASKTHQMTRRATETLCWQLLGLKASLMITASRRTGADNTRLLRDTLQGPDIYFWDGTGDNPYFALLAHADYIIVTEDSVSMASEAISTGKPVYIAALDGDARRLSLFHKLLQEQGYTRPFTGTLQPWSYVPPRDTIKAATEIRKRLAKENS